tara:strand:- start:269 stop:478 length:210 start_codon:yes stop_codon:yes gene_type:complete
MTVNLLQTVLNNTTVIIKFTEPKITNFNFTTNVVTIALQQKSENKTSLSNERILAGDGNIESITSREIQ